MINYAPWRLPVPGGPAALAGHGRDLEISRARASLPGKWRLPGEIRAGPVTVTPHGLPRCWSRSF